MLPYNRDNTMYGWDTNLMSIVDVPRSATAGKEQGSADLGGLGPVGGELGEASGP